MCVAAALPIAGLAMSAGSTLMQYQAGKAQAAATNAAYAQNQVAALAAQKDTQRAITTRQMQEAGASEQAVHTSVVDQARRQASVVVSSIDAGRSGTSVDALVNDVGRVAEDNQATLKTNWENTAAQLQQEKEGTEGTYMQRVNSRPQAAEPSLLTPLMGLAGAGLKYFTDSTKADTAAEKV